MRKSETSTVATWRKGLATSNGSDRKNRGTSQEGVDPLDWMAWMASRACPTSSPLLQTLSHTKNCLSSACHLPCASWGAGLHEQPRLDLLTENGPPPIWQCLLINITLEDPCAGGTWEHISEYRAFSQSIVVFFFNSRPRLRSLFCHNCAAREQDPNFLVFNP